jgi:hypothetical protein
LTTIEITTSKELSSRETLKIINVLMGLDSLNEDPLIIINGVAQEI